MQGILQDIQKIISENNLCLDKHLEAKFGYLVLRGYKRSLDFPACMKHGELYLLKFKDHEKETWKYLYKVNTIIAKTYQMINSLNHCMKYMNEAIAIVQRNITDKNDLQLGIIYRITGYQYWKFLKRTKSTIYKEKGDMSKEVFETDVAQQHYEQFLRYTRMNYKESHFRVAKVYVRLADNLMRDRGNPQQLKKAEIYLQKYLEIVKEIEEIQTDEEMEVTGSLYIALYYQFLGKYYARLLDKENSLLSYKKSHEMYIRGNNGVESLICQSFYQFIIDDLAELNDLELSIDYNKKYK
ncbi:UNKNOWN [Stylonychia lemnae]|uniref:Uncharacterized protein n=1 Tax=Stylonychia lemnae TaxID=5949 RepID=A0A078AZL6_STYLE|nr:UNKNOWN [Stylonychia lemnae]|eukprot:CDW87624.1 UNKNOWN [Stylonychia lemnae]